MTQITTNVVSVEEAKYTEDSLLTQKILNMTSSIKKICGLSAFCMSFYIAAPVVAHPCPDSVLVEPTTHPISTRVTKSPSFLRNCGAFNPANVASINSGCSIIPRSLVGSRSTVQIISTVNRTSSGQSGIWYRIRVVSNSTSNQVASVNAGVGVIGWLRANKL